MDILRNKKCDYHSLQVCPLALENSEAILYQSIMIEGAAKDVTVEKWDPVYSGESGVSDDFFKETFD